MDDMNDLVSYDMRPLDVMNHLGLWMLITILYHALKSLYVITTQKVLFYSL